MKKKGKKKREKRKNEETRRVKRKEKKDLKEDESSCDYDRTKDESRDLEKGDAGGVCIGNSTS